MLLMALTRDLNKTLEDNNDTLFIITLKSIVINLFYKSLMTESGGWIY